MMEKLGANVVIDYKQRDADAQIISEGPYVIQYHLIFNILFLKILSIVIIDYINKFYLQI